MANQNRRKEKGKSAVCQGGKDGRLSGTGKESAKLISPPLLLKAAPKLNNKALSSGGK